ncbi:MAG: hypothetical protein LBI87_01975 [Candidatus Accumulibacter sp.]|jgi:hypothetical protein|nr:hypothetical protein [Accumulibacter sp.]
MEDTEKRIRDISKGDYAFAKTLSPRGSGTSPRYSILETGDRGGRGGDQDRHSLDERESSAYLSARVAAGQKP